MSGLRPWGQVGAAGRGSHSGGAGLRRRGGRGWDAAAGPCGSGECRSERRAPSVPVPVPIAALPLLGGSEPPRTSCFTWADVGVRGGGNDTRLRWKRACLLHPNPSPRW